MESLRNLALNAVPLNTHVPAYFAEDVRIARIFKQLLIDGEFVTRALTDEEIQAMKLLKSGFIPIGWKRFKHFNVARTCYDVGHLYNYVERDTLQSLMIKYGICGCNKLLFKPRGSVQYAFYIEKNEFVPVDKMDSGYFNYITKDELVCETKDDMSITNFQFLIRYNIQFLNVVSPLVDAFPTVKPMVILRKKTSIKINIGCSLQEFFEINKQWWGHDTTIDKDILFLYQSDILCYICTEVTNGLYVELSIKSENIEQIKQMLSSRLWYIKTPRHIERL
jgi:hypothetical protein